MWFEIIPSFAIITGALALPGYALYGLHKLTLGNVSGSREVYCVPCIVLICAKCKHTGMVQ